MDYKIMRGHVVAQLVQALRYKRRRTQVSFEYFNDITLPAAQWPWGPLTLLTVISTRNTHP